ncbi:MAG TPA: type III-B CRISPR-associated protein Cas10/Cmr2 [bacterium]|nr:type III-B CRISPR-associated protein Cas10/Cmr2 [bacterium]
MTEYLFLFTIGPVQSFIVQARKTQDLYAGSFLISRLCGFAAEKLVEGYGGKIIFPSDIFAESLPNRFIGKIEADESSLQAIGKEIEKSVRDEFRDIAFKSLKKYDKDIFKMQIDTFLDIHWVFQPLSDYQKDYVEIEQILGSIKNIRTFVQISETGRKCSLCGERNVLFYRKRESEKWIKDNRPSNKLLPKLLDGKSEIFEYNDINLNKIIAPGEGLCAICFTKRNLSENDFSVKFNDSFPSTSNIALYHAISQLPEDFKNPNKFDAQGILALKDGKHLNETEFEYIEDTCKVYEQLKDKKIKISDYYALVMFDGDHMGKWLSGEYIKDKSRLEDFHKELSRRLTNFGKWSKEYICGKDDNIEKGHAVYAGGDDFMGFVCLDYLMEVMQKLRDEFDVQVNEPMHKKFAIGEKLTISAGIIIIHYKDPLSEALKWARKMEHEAKENGGRDAFAIAVMKHSGEIRKTIWKWNYESGGCSRNSSEVLKDLSNVLHNDKTGFSNTFIKNLESEFGSMKVVEDGMMKAELKRLLGRSSKITGDRKNKEVKNWSNKLKELYADSQTGYMESNFFSALDIVDFIARETR